MAGRSARGDGRVDLAVLAVALLLSVIALAMPDARADRIASALRRTVFAPLATLQARAEHARRGFAAVDLEIARRDTLALRALDADRLGQENERLRLLIGLGARMRAGFVPAEVLHGPALGEEHTVVLNAGSRAGVDSFAPVIAPEGIVGYVRSVDRLSSVAIVWPHPDFRVSAMAMPSGAFGVVSAHLGDGSSRYLLEFRGVPYRTPLDTGTLVVSSGLGGTFPRGIPIGRVIRELPSQEGWARNYLLLPAVHPSDVGAVLILLRTPSRPDLTSVWAQADSVPKALQRVIGAADSLARGARARDTTRMAP